MERIDDWFGPAWDKAYSEAEEFLDEASGDQMARLAEEFGDNPDEQIHQLAAAFYDGQTDLLGWLYEGE